MFTQIFIWNLQREEKNNELEKKIWRIFFFTLFSLLIIYLF